MTDVDTSIYKSNQPPPAPINPLQMYGQVVATKNALAQNKLLQQQQDLRSGMTAATQASVDPVTGQVDSNKLLGLISQDPRTAWNFGDVNAQTQANTQATAQAQKAQLENGLAHVQAVNSTISGVLGDPGLGKVDMKKKIIGGIVDIVGADGAMLSPQAAAAQIQQIPDDPAGQLAFVRGHANQNLALQGKLEQILGSPTYVSTGAQTIQQRTPTVGGAPMTTGALTNTTSPETNAALVTTYQKQPDGTFQAIQVPRSSLPGASGVAGGGGGPVAPPMPAAPSAPQQPSGATPGPQAASSPAPSGILAAPPPGVNESQGADIAKFKTDQAAIPTHATNVQSLQKAQTALEALSGPFGTGKGTEGLAHLRSVITSLTGYNDASTMSYDEAKKYLLDYAKSQGAAAHSDQQLNAALGSNASTDISNKAALDVVKTNIGRERQAIAQVQENANPTGIGYGAHAAKFATATDPRAFAWNEYSYDEQQKIIKSLTPAQKSKLVNSLNIAKKYGFTQPEGANGQQ